MAINGQVKGAAINDLYRMTAPGNVSCVICDSAIAARDNCCRYEPTLDVYVYICADCCTSMTTREVTKAIEDGTKKTTVINTNAIQVVSGTYDGAGYFTDEQGNRISINSMFKSGVTYTVAVKVTKN